MCEYSLLCSCTAREEEGVGCHSLSHSKYSSEAGSLPERGAHIFSRRLENLHLHAIPGDRITGMHEVLGLLHGCWDANSSLHDLIFQPICTIFEIIVSILRL